MNKTVSNSAVSKTLEWLLWVFCIAAITWRIYPILSDNPIAGWDMPGHFYLYNLMLEYLKHGKISGYDPNWYGGFAAFTLYPPLTYVLMALPHIASFKLIPVTLSFNIFIFALPFFFLITLCWTGCVFFGRRAVPLILAFGLMYLFLGIDYAHSSLGIAGLIMLGLPASNFALCLLILLLGWLEVSRRNPSLRKDVVSGFLFALIILSHSMTSIFALWLVFWFAVFRKGTALRAFMITTFVGMALSAFWWIPFVQHLWLSSGNPIGLRLEQFGDPLFLLYPNLTAGRLHAVFQRGEPVTHWTRLYGGHMMVFEFNQGLVEFPYFGLLLLAGGIAGIVMLLRREDWFLPCTFLISLLILPRELFSRMFTLALHYYRFIQDIFVLNILLAAAGWMAIFGKIAKIPLLWIRSFTRAAVLIFFCLALLITSLFGIDWKQPSRYSRYAETQSRFFLHFDEYPQWGPAWEMLQYIGALKPEGRVAVEGTGDALFSYGSPHFFTSFLPLEYGVEVFPGLLAESAPSTGFINPTLAIRSNHFTWGRENLIKDPDFTGQSLESMIERLGLYHVQYILSTSNEYYRNLRSLNPQIVKLQEQTGPFALFKINQIRPFIEATSYSPFLFVDRGGTDFRTFSEQWFKYPKLFDKPVIYAAQPFQTLATEEQSQIAGFIVSYPGNVQITQKEYEDWKASGKQVIFLNARPPSGLSRDEREFFFPEFHKRENHARFAELLVTLAPKKIERTAIVPEIRETEQLKFRSAQPTLINYNYDTRWRSRHNGQTIYFATPSLMFVFGRGDNELRYE